MLPLTPTKLGRYEVVDEIGKGAMGVVYLARDPLIGRLVALKTFRIGYSVKDEEMEQFRIRFIREAQSAGILTHPNIVTIHDVVEDSGDGLAFIAMEYVRGTNLKLLLQGEQPLSLQFVLETIAQVGDALDYAHSNRVVHRDVKPANILITSENRVKITDFGIARLDSSNLTQEGQLLGTPNYMAPEQIQGKEVDWRADLFSLGVVVYEMFTRHKPFQGENLTVVSHRIVYDHFTPPQDYVKELPPGVDNVLSRALEKDPARRFQRAREMVDELRRTLETSAPRDDLNETQSLSSTMVLPPSPPPLPPLPPSARAAKPSLLGRWRNRPAAPPPPLPAVPPPSTLSDSGTLGSSASLPPPPPAAPPAEAADALTDTLATQAPPPPAASRHPISLRWLLVGGGTAALVLLLGGAAFLLWRRWSQPAPPPPPVQQAAAGDQQRQTQIKQLTDQGYAAMRRGDFGAAVELFRQAEQIDPSRQDVQRLREMAEAQAQDFTNLVSQEKAIAANVAGAKRALAARNYSQAASLASLALGIDANNEDAKAVLAKAQQGQARLAKQRIAAALPETPGPGNEMTTTAPATEETRPAAAEPGAAEVKTSSLQVHFRSDVDAILIVRVDNKELFRKDFSRGGFFRPRRGDQGHEWRQSIEVPAGTLSVVVHVAPRGLKARVQQLGGNFPGGGARRLEIYLSKSADLSAQLI